MANFGVSPAFVVSRHGTHFTVEDYCASATAARELGFTSLQAEIYTDSALLEWNKGGARRVAAHFAGEGMHCSQFVAHFLLANFSSAERLAAADDAASVLRAIECARAFPDCRVFTVPIAPFEAPTSIECNERWYAEQRRRLAEKIRTYLELVVDADLTLALEILPYSLIGNSDGFLRLANVINSPDLGVNLDTGHAWCSREVLPLLPGKLHRRIFGVHLKDGDGGLNQPHAPGRGTIPWAAFLRALPLSGYTGPLDLEIGCAPDRVNAEYQFGRDVLTAALPQSTSARIAIPA